VTVSLIGHTYQSRWFNSLESIVFAVCNFVVATSFFTPSDQKYPLQLLEKRPGASAKKRAELTRACAKE